jgi:hypothetical protein
MQKIWWWNWIIICCFFFRHCSAFTFMGATSFRDFMLVSTAWTRMMSVGFGVVSDPVSALLITIQILGSILIPRKIKCYFCPQEYALVTVELQITRINICGTGTPSCWMQQKMGMLQHESLGTVVLLLCPMRGGWRTLHPAQWSLSCARWGVAGGHFTPVKLSDQMHFLIFSLEKLTEF